MLVAVTWGHDLALGLLRWVVPGPARCLAERWWWKKANLPFLIGSARDLLYRANPRTCFLLTFSAPSWLVFLTREELVKEHLKCCKESFCGPGRIT